MTKLIGYSDYGNANLEPKNTKAKEVLVFLVASLNGHWRLPIAYFLLDKINSTSQASLVHTAVYLCSVNNLRVRSITCDGCSTNWSTMRQLGCKVGGDDFDGKIETEEKFPSTVRFVPDACHLLKLARNCLATYKVLKNENDEEINFKYLDKLHKLQKELNLKFANKIMENHIKYGNNTMKVKFAAQLLSSSVADALEFLKSSNITPFPKFRSDNRIHPSHQQIFRYTKFKISDWKTF